MLQQLGTTCSAYGFKPGTDAYTSCVFRLDQDRLARNRQALADIGQNMSETGDRMMQNAQVRRPIQCQSYKVGTSVNTNCF
ncbi:hypothetical protein [Mesorhizobium loti]|uniref:hypothetical protein n=1 Tax=Rhizobium loti TaxID=381 RepID=UPI0004223FB8|nr:hypothetical protein [Mesorhizobium loti]